MASLATPRVRPRNVRRVSGTVLTDMSIALLLARIRGPIALWTLAGVSLLASHDAIFLAQVGPGKALTNALREAGHDYWGTASLVLAAVGIAMFVTTLMRLRSLRHQAAASGPIPIAGSRVYIRHWLRAWTRLLPVVAIGFLVQENIEHVIAHGHAPGLGALLGPEYPLAMPVMTLITGLAALVAAALRQTERSLLAVIADAMRHVISRAPRRTPRPPLRLAAVPRSPLSCAWAGRGPPPSLVSAT